MCLQTVKINTPESQFASRPQLPEPVGPCAAHRPLFALDAADTVSPREKVTHHRGPRRLRVGAVRAGGDGSPVPRQAPRVLQKRTTEIVLLLLEEREQLGLLCHVNTSRPFSNAVAVRVRFRFCNC